MIRVLIWVKASFQTRVASILVFYSVDDKFYYKHIRIFMHLLSFGAEFRKETCPEPFINELYAGIHSFRGVSFPILKKIVSCRITYREAPCVIEYLLVK